LYLTGKKSLPPDGVTLDNRKVVIFTKTIAESGNGQGG
jgi:hypothetical protein